MAHYKPVMKYYYDPLLFGVSTKPTAKQHLQQLRSADLELKNSEPCGEEQPPKVPLGGLYDGVFPGKNIP